ncbi:MAG: recombinase family protein [Alicyclobacillus macrosporangiidus]|uniref:recombinase family protein n=1 Tax=Alicyclobacillus macrosporangiidus TaxID=392015 RepID=UPI0026EBA908|nr:recombinase family protein [Alicyclobacillus macrosporangiidus]MCL6599701.1 recombinase family protein [Alicyclobacillus macrosporangiidus]
MPEFPTNLSNVAMYLRKSRADLEAESRGESETLSRHRTALLRLAEKYRYGIRDTYEEIVSGERILDRPEMQKLLKAVQAGKYSAVLCMDLDRLGRGNMVDQGLIQEAFKASNTLIITPRKVYDLQDELDEEWSEFEAFMARRELKIITRRLQRGRKQSASQGRSISKKPPYGYLRDESLRLFPDPETAPVVEMIFRMAADGYGMTRICKHLTSLGIPTPAGKRIWERSSVYAILKNPVYRGHIVWGRMKYDKSPSSPSKYERIRQAPENWLVTENAHQPLVDEETYERYLSRLERLPKVQSKRALSNPLATLIYCSRCGRTMRRQPTYNRPHNRLLCTTVGCPTRSASFELVEERVLNTLRDILANMKIETKPGASQNRSTYDTQLQMAEKQIAQANDTIRTLTEQKNALHDLLEQRIYDVTTYLERSRVIEQRMDQARRQLETAQAELQKLKEQSHRLDTFVPQLTTVIESYELAPDAETKNKLLRTVIDRILYTRNQDWSKPDHFELEIFLRL